MGITINPYVTTVTSSSFNLVSDGFVQGMFLDDPAIRYQLEGGVVSSSQSTPIWGGMPLALTVPTPNSTTGSSGLGPIAAVAASSGANINAWCLFNQASAGVISPGSPVPLYPASTSLNFARIGCGMRVVLPCKAADVATIAGGSVTQTLYWDFTNNYVTVTAGTGALGYEILGVNQNSKTVSYNSGTGAATWVNTGSVIIVRI